MVKQCIVYGCKKESFRDCGITFFQFPKDIPLRQRWVDAVGRVTKYPAICHLHFKPEDIISVSSKPKLRPNAVPSIFPTMKFQDELMESNSCLEGPVLEILPLNVPNTSRELPCTVDFSDVVEKKVQILRRQVKILRQRLKRRDEKVKEVKNVLKMIKHKCSTFDEVKNVIKKNNFSHNQTGKQFEGKGDKSVKITIKNQPFTVNIL